MLQQSTRLLALLLSLGITMTANAQRTDITNPISLVPKPVSLVVGQGVFELGELTVIVYDKSVGGLDSIARHLSSRLHIVTGYDFPTSSVAKGPGSIVLSIDPTKGNLREEGYSLTVSQKEIQIRGFDEAGVFYGVQTLFQLMPPEIVSVQTVHGMSWKVPCVKIEDFPRFGWRGMHLDVGRHFFPVDFIKKYLDLMAMYKLNVFHWHLTEDQGWRIEIKKYPRLTQVGAWRKETMGDGVPHGGFYTQDQIRDVVSYAARKHIEVVPEIEMPGHANAALAAYPRFSCRQVPLDVATKWGIVRDVFCPGNDSTFGFVQDILSEVFDLFPSKYIHIGGDECPKDRWKECPRCQARMKAEGLKDEQELQSYFVRRIEQYVNAKGKRMIGWDEILEGGLAPNATVMSWRGTQGGIDAAKSGHDVIMSPTSNCYFDYAQSLTGEEDMTDAFLPIDSVYDYEPVPGELNADESKHVLGSQANLWTEWVPDTKRAEYMLLPRMCALSEMVWTQKNLRNYDDFARRMESHYDRFALLGVNFRVPTPFSLGGNIMSFADTTIAFSTLPQHSRAYYTLDGTEPTQDSRLYENPVVLNRSLTLKAKLFLSNGMSSNTVAINFSKLDSTTNGLKYAYGKPAATGSTVSNSWTTGKSGVTYAPSLPNDSIPPVPFTVRFDGFLAIERAGLYTFYLRADSGSVLAVNNVVLVNGGLPDARWWRYGKIELPAGKYPIAIIDLEMDQWAGVTLEYEGPGLRRQPVPPRLFTRR